MTIRFPDLSHWPEPSGRISLDGVVCLLTKATQGTSAVDPTYLDYKAAAAKVGAVFGGFHYVTTDNPQAQAEHAYRHIGPDTPCMWDVEKGSGTVAHLLAVHDAYVKLGGRATLAYIPHWYWQGLGSPSLLGLTSRGLTLIASDYGVPYSPTGRGYHPYGGVTPGIWQYTSSAHLNNGSRVDMNGFEGTLDELRAIIEGEPDMASAPLTAAEAQLVVDTLLNDKNAPKLVAAIFGTDGVEPNYPWMADAGANATVKPYSVIADAGNEAHSANLQSAAAVAAVAGLAKQITALTALIQAGSGSPDTAAILQAIATEETAIVTETRAEAAAAKAQAVALAAQVSALQAKLAAAEQASATALAK